MFQTFHLRIIYWKTEQRRVHACCILKRETFWLRNEWLLVLKCWPARPDRMVINLIAGKRRCIRCYVFPDDEGKNIFSLMQAALAWDGKCYGCSMGDFLAYWVDILCWTWKRGNKQPQEKQAVAWKQSDSRQKHMTPSTADTSRGDCGINGNGNINHNSFERCAGVKWFHVEGE